MVEGLTAMFFAVFAYAAFKRAFTDNVFNDWYHTPLFAGFGFVLVICAIGVLWFGGAQW